MTEIEALKTKLNHQMEMCQELIKLCHEQRASVKKRQLDVFQATTEALTQKYEDFHNSYIDLCQEGVPEDADLVKLWRELNEWIQQLQQENQINMLLINNSLQVMRQVTKFLQPENSLTYEDKGNIKLDSITTNTLNKTV